MLLGGLFYVYENNPLVFNALAQAGIETNILEGLGQWENELKEGEYYSFINDEGQVLEYTNRQVYVGDELILEDNNRYKVTEIDEEKRIARCQLVGLETISYKDEWDLVAVSGAGKGKKMVAIYSTHTAESYVPTDGTESKPGKGGIKKVGSTFAEALQKNGVNAEYNDNNHDPHDANAYHRSRKTAAQLLKNSPVALIDVHRDGVPDPNFYKTSVDGESATKIRLVVGRQNPHMSANLDFAKEIKAYFDKNYPGLIKGIYMAKGNYNQDLSPRAILIEVGTHTNSREAAERGVAKFAEGLPKLLGAAGAGPGGGAAGRTIGKGTASAIIWLILAVVIGGGIFLLISTGSIKGSLSKLSNIGKEFTNYLGPIRKKDKGKE